MATLLRLSNAVELADWEVEITQIRAQGPADRT